MRATQAEPLRAGPIIRTAVCVVAACTAVLAARAQTPAGPVLSARVTSFSTWNDADRPLQIGLHIENTGQLPVSELRVRVAMHSKVFSRSELGQSLDGNPTDESASGPTDAIEDEMAPGEKRDYEFSRPLSDFSNSFRPHARASSGGVYPVEIQLRGSGGVLWSAWTAVVFVPSPPLGKLNVTWVLPVHLPYLAAPDGTIAGPDADAALGPRGAFRALAKAVAAAGASAVTLAPTPQTLDQLAAISKGYRRRDSSVVEAQPGDAVPRGAAEALANIKTAASTGASQLASVPYSRADLVTLIHGNVGEDATTQMTGGATTVRARLGHDVARSVLVPADLDIDSRAAALVSGLGVRTVVLGASTLPVQQGQFGFGPDQPVTVSGRGGVQLNALLADGAIRERLESQDQALDDVLRAQDVIAETASAWYERPSFAAARGIVVASSVSPAPATVSHLAQGLAGAPWIAMRTASQLLEAVPPSQQTQPLRLGDAPDTPELIAQRTAHRALGVLDSILIDGRDDLQALQRLAFAGESADWKGTTHGLALTREAKLQADRIVGRIRPAQGRRVTLTSRTGQLPITVINTTPYIVRVEVALSSAKVEFPSGARRTIEVRDRPATITVPAKARGGGSFGVDVQLRTPDGAIPLGSGELVVRSTAVSSVALFAVGGGLLFIIASWLRRNRRGHSRRAA